MAFAVFGCAVSLLALLEVGNRVLLFFAVGYAVVGYLAGLLVHCRETRSRFIRDGAIRGRGYAPYFRRARRSLLLTHCDEDAPSEELLGIYSELLERGVELRRVVFLRGDHRQRSYEWLHRFGEREGLENRFVQPDRSEVARLSFVVVDERYVILSIPGGEAVDGEHYSRRFVLRHLLVVEDKDVAVAFTEVHRQLWLRATSEPH